MEIIDGVLGVGKVIAGFPSGVVITAPADEVLEASTAAIDSGVEDFVNFPFQAVVHFDRRGWW